MQLWEFDTKKEWKERETDAGEKEKETEQVVVVWGFKCKTQQQLKRDAVPLNFKCPWVCVCVFQGVSRAPVAEGNLGAERGPSSCFCVERKEWERREREGGERGVTQCQMAGCGVTGGGQNDRKWEGQTEGEGLWAGFRVCSLAHPWCMNGATAVLKY